MPELPEVETVRAGLERWVVGRVVASVQVSHPRALRRHVPGAAEFCAWLVGREASASRRRGKYLWIEFAEESRCLVAHLGMSGQLLLQPDELEPSRHTHAVFDFVDDGPQLRFVDQRTFGGLYLDELVAARDLAVKDLTVTDLTVTDLGAVEQVPGSIAHIGRDPFDSFYSPELVIRRIGQRRSGIKRVLLDQAVLSGVGNIYADESLWRARIHPEREAASIGSSSLRTLLDCVREVMSDALSAGGTSFDSLYVNVNGESGYFARDLDVYGREGLDCHRCGGAIRRDAFMNRSSFFCPRCQRLPAKGLPAR